MKVIAEPKIMHLVSLSLKNKKKTIGLVPTMGALHEGHLKLVEEAKKSSDVIVVSIFINPTQFGPKEDFNKYPRDIRKDSILLNKLGVDYLFYPQASDMYPEGYKTYIEVKGIQDKLCGASRPGHFKGVATVVAKLFNIIAPDTAFFGEKDFQQQVIIKKMVNDLNMDVAIKTISIVRENDGLAKSSRNRYLSKTERKSAPLLYKALRLGKLMIDQGEKRSSIILSSMKSIIKIEPKFRIDYISICDPETFEEKKIIKGKILIAIAAYLGKTRLIDNILVK